MPKGHTQIYYLNQLILIKNSESARSVLINHENKKVSYNLYVT